MPTYNAYTALLNQYVNSLGKEQPKVEQYAEQSTDDEMYRLLTPPRAEEPEVPAEEKAEPYKMAPENATFDYFQFATQNYESKKSPMGFAAGGAAPVRPAPAAARGPETTPPPTVVGGPAEGVSEADSVADDIPKDVEEGSFVINAPAVEFAGSEDIQKMLLEAMNEAEKLGIDIAKNDSKITRENLVRLVVSKGEVIVPRVLAEIIGYDRLEKINNRGKKEVEKRIAENGQDAPPGTKTAADGGKQDNVADTEVIDVYRSIIAQGGDPGRFQVFEKAFQEYQKGKVYRPMQSDVGTPEFDAEVRSKYGYAFPETKEGMLEESTYVRDTSQEPRAESFVEQTPAP